MKFGGWQKTSLIEYPGKVSTVLFTTGCNFKCPFCYNSDLVFCTDKIQQIDEKDVLDTLSKRAKLYQAVIVTGGEPTMQNDLPGFFEEVKKLGLLTGLETNGTNPRMLKDLIESGLVDYVAMDIKAPLTWKKYSKAAGIKDKALIDNVKESVKIIMGSETDYEFRTTVVPKLHTEDDILSIAASIKGAKRYVLQQFTPKDTMIDAKLSGKNLFSCKQLNKIKAKMEGNFGECEIRNC